MPPPIWSVWFVAQAAPDTPSSVLVQLGAFAVAAFVGWMWIRDVTKQRDAAMAGLSQVAPLLIELRDVQRASTTAHERSAAAMQAMSDSLERFTAHQLTERDVVLIRAQLDDLEEMKRRRRADER